MAERISTFNLRPRGPKPKYPWGDWADGSAWRIFRGEDYTVGSPSMARAIYGHAYTRDLDVFVRILTDPDGVEFQFRELQREPNGEGVAA